MIRQFTILTFFLTICLTGCAQAKIEPKNQELPKNSYKLDTSVVAILPLKTTQFWVFENNKPSDLTNDDLQRIETILNKSIKDYNPKQERQFKKINNKHPEYKLDKENFIINLTQYRRQYVASLNSKGEKEVWVNCFCEAYEKDWTKDLIIVNDGGNCFSNLKINLSTGKYYEFRVNGEA
jgi:hypothetical protein